MRTRKIMSMDDGVALFGWGVHDGEPPARGNGELTIEQCMLTRFVFAPLDDPSLDEWDWFELMGLWNEHQEELKEWLCG